MTKTKKLLLADKNNLAQNLKKLYISYIQYLTEAKSTHNVFNDNYISNLNINKIILYFADKNPMTYCNVSNLKILNIIFENIFNGSVGIEFYSMHGLENRLGLCLISTNGNPSNIVLALGGVSANELLNLNQQIITFLTSPNRPRSTSLLSIYQI